ALKEIGKPITNTTMLGAFAGATKELKLESIVSAIHKRFPEKLAKSNEAAIKHAFEKVVK
ncbi:MAG: 2-oxoacid:acceptor oxidoreductase family protein, partial [Candidatus Diapherotrites archaeon]|nr:2-oxoacid:acceptor oxidoreductase family protein [Candidatus Diapherotrites archaeon]